MTQYRLPWKREKWNKKEEEAATKIQGLFASILGVEVGKDDAVTSIETLVGPTNVKYFVDGGGKVSDHAASAIDDGNFPPGADHFLSTIAREMCEKLTQYQRKRLSLKIGTCYSNDLLTLVCAELTEVLVAIARETYTSDFAKLRLTVQKRIDYIKGLQIDIFKPSSMSSFKFTDSQNTKNHLFMQLIEDFEKMLDQIEECEMRTALLDDIRKIEGLAGRVVADGTRTLAHLLLARAPVPQLSMPDLINFPDRYKSFLSSSFGQMIRRLVSLPSVTPYAAATAQNRFGIAIADSASDERDGSELAKLHQELQNQTSFTAVTLSSPEQVGEIGIGDEVVDVAFRANPATLQEAQDFAFCVSMLGDVCTLLPDLQRMADKGGRLLTMGCCKESTLMTLALVDNIAGRLVGHINRMTQVAHKKMEALKLKRGDPMKNPWLKHHIKEQNGYHNFTLTCQSLRFSASSLIERTKEYDVQAELASANQHVAFVKQRVSAVAIAACPHFDIPIPAEVVAPTRMLEAPESNAAEVTLDTSRYKQQQEEIHQQQELQYQANQQKLQEQHQIQQELLQQQQQELFEQQQQLDQQRLQQLEKQNQLREQQEKQEKDAHVQEQLRIQREQEHQRQTLISSETDRHTNVQQSGRFTGDVPLSVSGGGNNFTSGWMASSRIADGNAADTSQVAKRPSNPFALQTGNPFASAPEFSDTESARVNDSGNPFVDNLSSEDPFSRGGNPFHDVQASGNLFTVSAQSINRDSTASVGDEMSKLVLEQDRGSRTARSSMSSNNDIDRDGFLKIPKVILSVGERKFKRVGVVIGQEHPEYNLIEAFNDCGATLSDSLDYFDEDIREWVALDGHFFANVREAIEESTSCAVRIRCHGVETDSAAEVSSTYTSTSSTEPRGEFNGPVIASPVDIPQQSLPEWSTNTTTKVATDSSIIEDSSHQNGTPIAAENSSSKINTPSDATDSSNKIGKTRFARFKLRRSSKDKEPEINDTQKQYRYLWQRPPIFKAVLQSRMKEVKELGIDSSTEVTEEWHALTQMLEDTIKAESEASFSDTRTRTTLSSPQQSTFAPRSGSPQRKAATSDHVRASSGPVAVPLSELRESVSKSPDKIKRVKSSSNIPSGYAGNYSEYIRNELRQAIETLLLTETQAMQKLHRCRSCLRLQQYTHTFLWFNSTYRYRTSIEKLLLSNDDDVGCEAGHTGNPDSQMLRSVLIAELDCVDAVLKKNLADLGLADSYAQIKPSEALSQHKTYFAASHVGDPCGTEEFNFSPEAARFQQFEHAEKLITDLIGSSMQSLLETQAKIENRIRQANTESKEELLASEINASIQECKICFEQIMHESLLAENVIWPIEAGSPTPSHKVSSPINRPADASEDPDFIGVVQQSKSRVSALVESCVGVSKIHAQNFWSARLSYLSLQDELKSKDEQLHLYKLMGANEGIDCALKNESDSARAAELRTKKDESMKQFNKAKVLHSFAEFKRKKAIEELETDRITHLDRLKSTASQLETTWYRNIDRCAAEGGLPYIRIPSFLRQLNAGTSDVKVPGLVLAHGLAFLTTLQMVAWISARSGLESDLCADGTNDIQLFSLIADHCGADFISFDRWAQPMRKWRALKWGHLKPSDFKPPKLLESLVMDITNDFKLAVNQHGPEAALRSRWRSEASRIRRLQMEGRSANRDENRS